MTAPEATDTAPAYDAGVKQKSSDKVSRIPVKVVHTGEALKKTGLDTRQSQFTEFTLW